MPWNFEDVSKEVAQGADDVKRSLEGLIETAEGVDRAFAKMTERQESALQVSEKFDKAMASSAKALSLFGHSGVSAARGLKTVDALSKSAASSLGAIGTGAASAVSGFRALSSETVSFSSDITSAERSIAGLVSGIGGLETKLKGISASSVPINVVVGSLQALDDLEQRIKALPKDVTVKVSMPTGSTSAPKVPTTLPAAVANAPLPAGAVGGPKAAVKAAKKTGYAAAKSLAKSFVEKIASEMRRAATTKKDDLELLESQLGTLTDKKQYIELAVKIAGEQELRDFLDDMDEVQAKLFRKDVKKMGMEAAIDSLIAKTPILGLRMKKAAQQAKEAAEEMTSQLKQLEAQMNKEAKTMGDLFGKQMAAGGVEAGRFADGLGANATGMMAVGVAGAFLATKLAEVAEKFADAAIGLARFKSDTAALERTIIGMNKGALEVMRKQLSLTRAQAAQFFDVVKTGVNDLGVSQARIMQVSKALQEAFGGDQTDRLRQYVDLLKEIPTLDADLSISASLDDQAAAVFGLAQAGKMDVVMDLQTAGVFGGGVQKQEGADMLNASQKTAAASEGIKDFLLNKMFPEWGSAFTEIVGWASKGSAALFAMVAGLGALKLFMGTTANAKTVAQIQISTARLEAAIRSQAALGGGGGGGLPKMTGGGGIMGKLGGFWKSIPKLTKALTGVAAVSFVAELGLGALANHLEKTGNKVGAAGATLGKSLAAIGGWAAAGAALGSVIPALGTAIGAVVGSIVGVVMEFSDLKKSIPTLFKAYFGKREPIADKEVMRADAILAAQQMKLVKSGMALQRSLSLIKGTFEGLKYELYRVEKEFAKLKIDNLSKIGGSTEAFGSAVKSAATTTRKMYDAQIKDAAKLRQKIMADADLNGEQRRQALNELHKQELRAVKDFVDGMNEVINALFESPAIIQAGLRAEIGKTTLGFAEGGGMGAGELTATQGATLDALEDKLKGVSEAAGAAAKASADKIAGLNAKRKQQEESISKQIEEGNRSREAANNEELKAAFDRLKQAQMEQSERKKKGPDQMGILGRVVAQAALPMMPGAGESAKYLQDRKKRNDFEEEVSRAEGEIAALEAEVTAKKAKNLARQEQVQMLERATVAQAAKGDQPAGHKVDYGKARDVLKEIAAEQDRITAEMEENREEIASNFNVSTARTAQAVAKQLAGAQKEAAKAQEAYDEALKSGEGLGAATEARDKAGKVAMDLQRQMDEITNDIADKLKVMAPQLDRKQAEDVAKRLAGVSGGMGAMEAELRKIGGLSEAARKAITASATAMQEQAALEERAAVLDETQSMLEGVVNAEDGINSVLADNLKSVQEIRDAAKDWVDQISVMWTVFDEAVYAQQRAANSAERAAVMARQVGSGISEGARAVDAETDLIRQQIDSYEASSRAIEERGKRIAETIPKLKKEEADAEAAAKAVENLDPKDAARVEKERAYEVAKQRRQAAEYMARNAVEEADKAKQAAAEVRERMGIAGDMIEKAIQDLGKSTTGARLGNLDELAGLTAEAAEYFGDVATAGRESFELAKKTAQERLSMEKEALEKGLEQDKKRNEERIQEAVNSARREAEARGGTASDADLKAVEARARKEVEATTESKRRLEEAKMEVKQKRAVVDAAKRSKELRERELDIQQSLIDDAMSFASDFGGSFSSIIQFQNMNVGIARQQLDAAKEFRDRVAEGLVEGVTLFEANAEVAKQTLNLRRKELGVQKDMMDRLLGSVFGELRGSFGARRNMGTDQALMGVNATRMKTAAGMYMNVPGGAPGTLAERAGRRATSGEGMGGVFGKAGGAEAQGVIGEVMKALKTAPKRSPLDEALGKAAGKTADATESTAKSVKTGETPGSFYTHDVTAESHATTSEGYLASILAVLKEMAVGVLAGGQGVGSGGKNAAKSTEEVRKTVEQAAESGVAAVADNADRITKEVAGMASQTKATATNTEESDTNLTKSLQLAKREMRNSLAELRLSKKGSKEQEKASDAFQKNLDKVSSLEAAVRTREIQNPFAGEAAGIEDYERVMAGKLPQEATEFSQIMGDGTKEATKAAEQGKKERKATGKVATAAARYLSGGKFDAGAKTLGGGKFDSRAKTLGGGKFDSRTMGSTDPRWAGRKQIGGSIETGLGGGKGVKAIGGSMRPSTAAGMKVFSSLKSKGNRKGFLTATGDEPMAEQAANKDIAPPTTGKRMDEERPGEVGTATGERLSARGAASVPGETRGSARGAASVSGGTRVSAGGAASVSGGTRGYTGMAAGTSVVPPTTGNQVASSSKEGGAASSEGVTFKVTGEMLVKFDNKMLKDALVPVVGQILPMYKNQIQGLVLQ